MAEEGVGRSMSFKPEEYDTFLPTIFEKSNAGQSPDELLSDFNFGFEKDKGYALGNCPQPLGVEVGPPQPSYQSSRQGSVSGPQLESMEAVGPLDTMGDEMEGNEELGRAGEQWDVEYGACDDSERQQQLAAGSGATAWSSDGAVDKQDSSVSPKRPRARSAHNVIEQRYRDRLNDRFLELQNSVPSLRALARKRSSVGENPSADDRLEGLELARNLSKGTILAKSVEYIEFLQLKNSHMRSQNEQLMIKAQMLGLLPSNSLPSPSSNASYPDI